MGKQTQYTAIISFTADEDELPNIIQKINEHIQENTYNGVKITIISPTDSE